MKFHVSRGDDNLGEFTIAELREGSKSGQFLWSDLVWREGMPQWQALDEFLRVQQSNPTVPPPIPLSPEQKRTRMLVGVIALVVLLGIGGVTVISFGVVKFVQRMRRVAAPPTRVDALKVASKPVAASTNAMTEANHRVRSREFRVRQWIEGYKKNADHSAPGDAEAISFLEAWIEEHYGAGNSNGSIHEYSDKMVQSLHIEDPLVLTIAGVEATELHESIRRLELAVKKYPDSHHKAYPRLYAMVMLANKLTDKARVEQMDVEITQQLRECFRDGSLTPDDAPEIADILIFGWGDNFFERSSMFVSTILPNTTTNKSWEWLSLVVNGEKHIDQAWRARGSGYANTVTSDGYRVFYSELQQASTCFERAWKLRPEWPLAPCRMIYVSLGLSDIVEMRAWFDRTVAAQLDYSRAWSDFRWGLRPRWYGDWQSMQALGVTALNTRRFDTDLPRTFFDSIAEIESEMELSHREHIYGRADVWPHLAKMYEGYIAEPTRKMEQDGWRSTYSVVAHLAGKDAVAREQLEMLNWKPREQNFRGWKTDLSLLPLEVAALTSPLANEIRSADGLRDNGEFQNALQAFQKLAADARADERTRQLVRARIAVLEIEAKLQRGEWVDFIPKSDDDPAWNTQRGTYHTSPDNAMDVASGKTGHMIVCRARVGPDFEIRGEFETIKSSTGDFQAGLVMGMPEENSADWLAFRMKQNVIEGQLATFSYGWTRRETVRRPSLNKDKNSFQFSLRDGLVRSAVNGQAAHKNFRSSDAYYDADEFLVGFGAFNDMNDTVIRYKNVQLRVIASTNAPAQGVGTTNASPSR